MGTERRRYTVLTDNQLKIAVCDNVPQDRAEIISMTKEILLEENIACSIAEYKTAGELLNAIRGGERFHIMLLDVLISDMNGIDLASLLRRHGDKALIVFISANREMALRGYEVAASRYLVKPLNKEKLKEALTYCSRILQEKKEILLPTKNGHHRILTSDIQYVEAFDRGTKFVFVNETIETRMRFCDAEKLLPKSNFILCHRAYIVNIAHIRRIRHYEFEMKSGAVIPISRYRYNEVSKQFFDYIPD